MTDSPHLTFEPRTVLASLVGGLLIVPAVALVTKALVEGLTGLAYIIHWFETVPLLVLFTAFVLNGWLNGRGRPETPQPEAEARGN